MSNVKGYFYRMCHRGDILALNFKGLVGTWYNPARKKLTSGRNYRLCEQLS